MERIALVGNKGSGKDTLADYLVTHKNYIKYNFANPVKEICKIMFGLSYEQLYGNKKDVIDTRWDITPRHIFQQFGTEFGHYKFYDIFPELESKIPSKTLWLKIFESFLEDNKDKNIVVADVRFQHEVDFLKKHYFNIIKINRFTESIDSHSSENDISLITNIDYTIYNNSSKRDLYNKFDIFIYVPF